MKQVIICYGCSKVIRKAGSFKAELTQRMKVGEVTLAEYETFKISLCRPCAKEAGYKVK